MHRSTVRRCVPTAAAVALAAAACADPSRLPTAPAAAPSAAKAAGQEIAGQYIVVFRDEVADVDGKVRDKAAKAKGKVKHAYKAALKGFAGELTAEAVAALRADPDVAYVEEDQVVTIDATQSNATWGLDRIDQRALPLSRTYTYGGTGGGVTAYIIDTGLLPGHQEFGGRAAMAANFVSDGNAQDCNGHGTHVSGTIGGATYGVAKGVALRGVRVLDCSGSGSNSGVIAGIDWVAQNAARPAVANMSLGGGLSQAVNDAVTRLVNAGVFVAVAAGNSSQDACRSSPASAPAVTTVAASTSTDARASYSNYGSCVDLYAPGSSITSAWYTSTTATNTISGTSMATPHVAGVAALYKGRFGDASQATVDAWLKGNATPNVITGNRRNTPNLLLYTNGL